MNGKPQLPVRSSSWEGEAQTHVRARTIKPPALARALRDTLDMQSASALFLGELARHATVPDARKLLFDLARIEQMLSLEVDAMVGQLTDSPLPDRPSKHIVGIKTAPEWSHLRLITYEQAITMALDCTRRAAHFLTDMAAQLDGPALDFFLTLAQSDEDRAAMLETSLDRRLKELTAGQDVRRVLAETLDAVRHAGRAYAWIARRTSRARTREFLEGMQEVCALHAANIQGLMGDTPIDVEDPVFEGLAAATSPALDCPVEDLDFEAALRMAMHAQKRAALVHGMLARAFPGEEAQQLLDIADAERRHAATVASVLDRITPHDDLEDTLSPPLAHAPRESWTCPAIPIVKAPESDDEVAPPSLRLVVG
jgi:rubrerythrin